MSLFPKLVFNGSLVGDSVHSLKSDVARLTQITRRSNFWSRVVTLDGSYPDLVWTHTLLVYKSSALTGGETSLTLKFCKDYYATSSLITASAAALKITDVNTATVLIDFGNCFLENNTLLEPDNILLTSAGLLQLQFIGTTCPTVNP